MRRLHEITMVAFTAETTRKRGAGAGRRVCVGGVCARALAGVEAGEEKKA